MTMFFRTVNRVQGPVQRLLRSRFAGTAGWSSIAVAISAVTGILTARGLGTESRGTLALVVTIAGLCVLVGALGSNVAIRRHLPRQDGVTLRGYERLSLILIAPLVIILFAVMYISAALIDPSFGRWQVGLAFVGYGVAYYFSNQALDLLNALGLVPVAARINAFGSAVCLLLVATSTFLGWGLVPMILSYAFSMVFQFVFAYVVVVRRGHRLDPSARGAKLLVHHGVQLLGLNLGQSITFRADTVMLGALSTPDSVGLYAVASSPVVVLRIPSNALGQLSFHQAASDHGSVRHICRSLVKLLAVLLPVAAGGWLTADWLVTFIYGQAYAEAADAFRILLLAELMWAPFLVFGRTVAGLGSTLGTSASGVTGVVAMVLSGLLLIPTLGALGAAWASVIAYSTMSAVAAVVLWRMTHQSRRVDA